MGWLIIFIMKMPFSATVGGSDTPQVIVDRDDSLYAIGQDLFAIILHSFIRAQMQRQKAREDSLMSEGEEKQRIELFISCRNLDDLDFITVTDSFLVVKLLENNQPEKVILKTKVYWNDLNPNYAETALIDFYFEIKQKLIFEVFHYDTPPKLVGRMETSVGEIFGSPQHGLVKDLVNKNKKAGKIIIRSQKEEKFQKKVLSLKFTANGLPNVTWWYFFGSTNAFFRIFRKRQGDELMVYQSQTISSTNPSWKEFRISERRLASNDANKDLDFRVYNFSKTGKHEVIANATFRVGSFANGAKFQLLNKIRNPAGVLYLQKFQARTQYQFGDYLQKGLQLALMTCIDFTASNGAPNDRKSLHFNTPGGSQYQKALSAVTSILLDYDYDKLVPVFGFGAKVKHPMLNTEKKVHHCFPINCNLQNPNLYQLDEIIKAYRNIMPYLELSGPTKFAELLKEAMNQCRDYKQLGTHYMILFILTDGEIHDKAEVIDLLIQCNTLPISLIIVGIGEGQFTIMEELDDDNCQMVDSKGNATQRDLVQFVKFADFSNNGTALAKEVLEELPRQVSEYYQLMNMSPDDIAKCYKQDDIMRVKEATVKGVLMEEEPINPYDRI